jgi:hypothetical protein
MTFKELLNRVRFDDVAHKLSLRFMAKWKAFCHKLHDKFLFSSYYLCNIE